MCVRAVRHNCIDNGATADEKNHPSTPSTRRTATHASTMSESAVWKQQPQENLQVVGVKGVRLKKFEQVVMAVLPHVQPSYCQLPPRPDSCSKSDDWPFDQLPKAARAFGTLEGQLSNVSKATRKENQLKSFFRCILALLPHFLDSTSKQEEEADYKYTIVDFGGGSGHLAIPLSLLLPSCRVIVVDLNERSLQLLHRKAKRCSSVEPPVSSVGAEHSSTPNINTSSDNALPPCNLQACEGIPNLFTFYGAVESFHDPFDMGVFLHLCGEATDVALRKCGLVKAQALVCAPCCVGKLNRDKQNPYIYHATNQHTPTVKYPQSQMFCQFLNNESDWNALAKAADYSDMEESRTSRNAARRTAKALLETDRRLFLEEVYSFQTALTRMEPWEATPKNDILLAWRQDIKPNFQCISDQECQADIQLTIDHLLVPTDNGDTNGNNSKQPMNSVDWTRDEEQEIRDTLQGFIASNNKRLVFPTRMGGRKRKLVHYVAEQMDLAHWCEGDRYADKTVGVSRRRIAPATEAVSPGDAVVTISTACAATTASADEGKCRTK